MKLYQNQKGVGDISDQSVSAASTEKRGMSVWSSLSRIKEETDWLAESQPPHQRPRTAQSSKLSLQNHSLANLNYWNLWYWPPKPTPWLLGKKGSFPRVELYIYCISASATDRALTLYYPYLGLDHRLTPKKLPLTSRNLYRPKQHLLCSEILSKVYHQFSQSNDDKYQSPMLGASEKKEPLQFAIKHKA